MAEIGDISSLDRSGVETEEVPGVVIDKTGENPWHIPAAASPENISHELRRELSQAVEELGNSPTETMSFLKPYIRAFEAYLQGPNLAVPVLLEPAFMVEGPQHPKRLEARVADIVQATKPLSPELLSATTKYILKRVRIMLNAVKAGKKGRDLLGNVGDTSGFFKSMVLADRLDARYTTERDFVQTLKAEQPEAVRAITKDINILVSRGL